MLTDRKKDVAAAETYYDSDDADRFYSAIWGGDDIHVGIYESQGEDIAQASRRTVERMAALAEMRPGMRVADLGAGYGGSARYLVERHGAAHVDCVNISETQNRLNREKTDAAGLNDRVAVIHGSFDDVPADDDSYDLVWSQDAFLHGADRDRIMEECARVTKPGGRIIFSDIMQAPDAPADKMQPVYDRIVLPSLGSIEFYDREAERLGLVPGPRAEMGQQLANHYGRVREELMARREELDGVVSADYTDKMIDGLALWVEGGREGWLTWGILSYDKPENAGFGADGPSVAA